MTLAERIVRAIEMDLGKRGVLALMDKDTVDDIRVRWKLLINECIELEWALIDAKEEEKVDK